MTIRPMHRLVGAVLVVALAFVACGRDGSGEAEAQAAAAAEAEMRRQLDEALDAVAAVEEQLAELAERVEENERETKRTATKLGRIKDRLWSSLAKVRDSVDEAEGAGAAAASKAAGALDQAAAAVRDLAVLENRFDYHLRKHGN